ncbi:hypothetical protein ACP70R_050040 [Stipagrostis hirtigluma subsp. patula]
MTVWDHACVMETDEERRRTSLYREKKNAEWEASDFKHHGLASLTIFNFEPEDYFVRYIRRVMEVAVNLEDVFLYRWLVCGKCRGKYPRQSRYPCSKKQRYSLRSQGIGLLAMIHFPPLLRAVHCERMQHP